MKKFNDPMADGKAPLFWNEGLNLVLADIYDMVESLFSDQDLHTFYGKGDGMVVRGCDVTPNASNQDISAGLIYFPKLKKFALIEAQTNVADPYYFVDGTTIVTQRTFKDGTPRDYILDGKADGQSSAPGGTNYVKFSASDADDNSLRFQDAMRAVTESRWRSGDLLLAAFTQGVSAVSSAKYQYRKMGDFLMIAFDFNLTTTAATIRFTLPDSIKHTAFDDDVFHHNGLDNDQMVSAYNNAGQTELVIQKNGGGNVEQFTQGVWIGKCQL